MRLTDDPGASQLVPAWLTQRCDWGYALRLAWITACAWAAFLVSGFAHVHYWITFPVAAIIWFGVLLGWEALRDARHAAAERDRRWDEITAVCRRLAKERKGAISATFGTDGRMRWFCVQEDGQWASGWAGTEAAALAQIDSVKAGWQLAPSVSGLGWPGKLPGSGRAAGATGRMTDE